MARPSVKHDGFLIPNAADVSNPRMAEPDRVDFNTLAHLGWGVINDCLVTMSGALASTTGGTALVNGQLVNVSPGGVTLTTGGTNDRFDLVVVDGAGTLSVVQGTPAIDPVFPDPPLTVTVLAAVFAPANAGAADLPNNVIDKRKFVNKALLTKIGITEDLIRNVNGTGNHFRVEGSGKSIWEGDTWMYRPEGPAGESTLKVHKHLHLEGTLTADENLLVKGDAAITGYLRAKNFMREDTAPATAEPATIYQNAATGKVYVYQNGWKEMATIESANPPGTIITSFETPEVMKLLGWLPLMGTEYSEKDYPSLFADATTGLGGVQGLKHLIRGASPNRLMTLPDVRKRMLVTDYDAKAGSRGGNLDNLVTLLTGNMPLHRHQTKTTPAGGTTLSTKVTYDGKHVHTVDGGPHAHDVLDNGHAHHGMDLGGMGIASAVIALMWNGQNKIDALFNDRNHTYSVEAMEWTMPAKTNIQVITKWSEHGHNVSEDGNHDHVVTVSPLLDHSHPMEEQSVGGNVPFDITPDYITVYSYVRT